MRALASKQLKRRPLSGRRNTTPPSEERRRATLARGHQGDGLTEELPLPLLLLCVGGRVKWRRKRQLKQW